MKIDYATFHLPKAGNKDEEYEDAFFPQNIIEQQEKLLSFGIADGASKSLLSKHWARILLECLQEYEVNYNQSKDLSEPKKFLEESLNIAYNTWESWKENYIQERNKRKKPVQWYEEPGLKKGAFSTFLFLKFIEPAPTLDKGVDQPISSQETQTSNKITEPTSLISEPKPEPSNLRSERDSTNQLISSEETQISKSKIKSSDFTLKELSASVAERHEQALPTKEASEDTHNVTEISQGKWVAVALGDSCLFQVRDNKLIHHFPMSSAAEFNNSPLLVSSKPSSNHHIDRVKKKEDCWQKGDRFYLMTDALACWFLNQKEKDNTDHTTAFAIALESLGNLESQKPEQFKEWIFKLRDNKEIRNDDVTLIRINIK